MYRDVPPGVVSRYAPHRLVALRWGVGTSSHGPSRRSSTLSHMADKTRGFTNNANKIAKKQGISQERARAILAASSRNASAAAKKKNPNLKKVK